MLQKLKNCCKKEAEINDYYYYSVTVLTISDRIQPNIILSISLTKYHFFFLKKIFVGHMSIFGTTNIPVSDFW